MWCVAPLGSVLLLGFGGDSLALVLVRTACLPKAAKPKSFATGRGRCIATATAVSVATDQAWHWRRQRRRPSSRPRRTSTGQGGGMQASTTPHPNGRHGLRIGLALQAMSQTVAHGSRHGINKNGTNIGMSPGRRRIKHAGAENLKFHMRHTNANHGTKAIKGSKSQATQSSHGLKTCRSRSTPWTISSPTSSRIRATSGGPNAERR